MDEFSIHTMITTSGIRASILWFIPLVGLVFCGLANWLEYREQNRLRAERIEAAQRIIALQQQIDQCDSLDAHELIPKLGAITLDKSSPKRPALVSTLFILWYSFVAAGALLFPMAVGRGRLFFTTYALLLGGNCALLLVPSFT